MSSLQASGRTRRPRLREEQLRDAVRELGEFTGPELAAHLGVAPAAVRRLLGTLLDRGVIDETGRRFHAQGPGRPAVLYAYQRPSQPGAAFELQQQQRTGEGRFVRRSTPVAASSTPKVANKEMARLVAAATAAGCRAERTAKHHLRIVTPQGQQVILPSTPSDHRSARNSAALLRRHGVAA